MKTKTRLAFFLIVLFQVLVLAGLVAFSEISIASGQAVVLQTGPVDPRDIFRGDYVALRYEISTLVNVPGVEKLEPGDMAYVRLEQRGDVWDAVEVSDSIGDTDNWPTFIRGDVTGAFGNRAFIEYGIGQYFVEEGAGLEIQNARDIKVRVKLSSSGQPFIEDLIVDGETYRLN